MTETPWTDGPLSVSAIRRTMDGQRWLRVCSENGWERAYVPFGDRTTAEYRQCMADAKLYAAAPELADLLEKIAADMRNFGTVSLSVQGELSALLASIEEQTNA